MSGRVVHFEVPFSDGKRARNFYQQAFGWKLNEMPEMKYTGVATGPVAENGNARRTWIYRRRNVRTRTGISRRDR